MVRTRASPQACSQDRRGCSTAYGPQSAAAPTRARHPSDPAQDSAGRLPRDASSTLGVTRAAAPVPSHPPHAPPHARHSQWRAAARPPRRPRAPAPANLRPSGGARRAIGCHARSSGPVPPTSLRQPCSIRLHSLSPRRQRQRGRGALALCRNPRLLPEGSGLPAPGQARRQRALTCPRLSSTRMRRRHPTPGHQTLDPAPACGVSTQPRP